MKDNRVIDISDPYTIEGTLADPARIWPGTDRQEKKINNIDRIKWLELTVWVFASEPDPFRQRCGGGRSARVPPARAHAAAIQS